MSGTDFCLQIGTGSLVEPAPFFLSVHKAGSTLQSDVVETLCEWFGLSFINIPAQLHVQGVLVRDCPLEVVPLLEQSTVCTGFREPWLLRFIRRYGHSPKILLLRDPRDVAVSCYFSTLHHPLPSSGRARNAMLNARSKATELTISEFVTEGQADWIMLRMRAFLEQAADYPNFKITRYEDVILKKKALVPRACERTKG